MIEAKSLASWDEFKKEITEIRRKYGYHEVVVPNDIEMTADVKLSEGRTYKRKNRVDILVKLILPCSVRTEALRELVFDYNITPFTLFQTEDSLVKTMELKQFDLDDTIIGIEWCSQDR